MYFYENSVISQDFHLLQDMNNATAVINLQLKKIDTSKEILAVSF